MATCKIWSRKDDIGQLIDYDENPDKTSLERNHDYLSVLVDYTIDGFKTSKGELVTGVNCTPQDAKNEMLAALKINPRGRPLVNVAYHGVQSWILGKTGAGKSFFAKQEMFKIILHDPTADIIIIDPENEYSSLVSAMGGETINISSTSPNHINPMDVTPNYGEEDGVPLPEKVEFILSLFELILEEKFTGMHQSIIDRCVKKVLLPYINNGYKGETPTLHTLYDELLKVDDSDLAITVAQELALEVEMFIKGTLDTFAYQTNVDTDSKILCYNIKDLSNSLRGIGMLTVLDNILNRISYNKENGRKTYIFIDEIYLLFMHSYSAEFLFKLWKRIRKYNGSCTGITQNVSDVLQSEQAETMLSNSELVVMLAQATSDIEKLSHLLNISEEEAKYVQGVSQGEGLIHIGNKNIPFRNKVPTHMQMYKLCSTKPGE